MGVSSEGDIDGEGDLILAGQALPPNCPTCGRRIVPEKFAADSPQEKRNRVSKTIKVPKDAQEDGVQVLEDLIEQLEERINPGYWAGASEDGTEASWFPGKHRPAYYTLCDALGYTLLNSTEADFVE